MFPVLHLKVFGRVQGVFFRAFVQDVANRLNLTGWVKNCTDNSVEIFAEGEKEKLRQFLEVCRKGPSGARVENIEMTWEERNHVHRKFTVMYDEN